MPRIPYEDTSEYGEASERERMKYRQKPYVYRDPSRPARWHILLFTAALAVTAIGLALVRYIVSGLGWQPGSNMWGILMLVALFGPFIVACVIELLFGRN